MFDLKSLFDAAYSNPRYPLNQAGRLMGRHCVARKERAQSKRRKHPRGLTPYEPR